ncbi:MAG: Thymidylate kinase [uncultured bacterium]|uniref:Thymidylate kinase n=4 Tax=Microgenomates group TaxID=1794810 RepID=A0A1F5K497_9BACT|nr:MAG: Thymidylate kinase [uncultured bacterium]KKQ14261.1 MAG: Thymidylate kinase [Candidatus Daviesbacteria bacterium GW2011_GWA1_36_8]KKQ75792.1 MAG: Thymidylate kinase [Candidatus Woesebacteria bacterium GW2011_GWB1_38_5b]OGE16814.1 MAG: hypothetical protein A2858_02830 [Candidatus Daviesbacteria bacterium RIFCSPHIGHO2_01_FULL_36_37]OGE31174.1 MAG: hypothetical protein A3C99_00800 [Candidatus Daviesbacteria bacterium RIFCSPHIGHO2_02_FULL_37_9]OGE35802.1 MAG: hypothetical protein A3E66_007
MSKGKLIVIEGTDGAGKGTQLKILEDKLKSLKIKFKVIDFPRYTNNLYGELVGRFLKGEFGPLDQVDPYIASLAYAGDRMLAGHEIKNWLADGQVVIANRYVLSNKAYMAARLPENERKKYINWLEKLEYGLNKVPREDLVIFLYVPSEIGQENVLKKEKRSHLGDKKRDIMEEDLNFQKKVAQIYLEFAIKASNWALIECTSNGKMRSKQEIHEEILKILESRRII